MESSYISQSGTRVMVDRRWGATSMSTPELMYKPLDQLFRMALAAESNPTVFAIEFFGGTTGQHAARAYAELVEKILAARLF